MLTRFILALLALPLAFSWTSTIRTRQISMSGGRSPSEKGLSKRGMFLQLKQKLKTAAEAPGFLQVGEGEPVSHLFCLSFL